MPERELRERAQKIAAKAIESRVRKAQLDPDDDRYLALECGHRLLSPNGWRVVRDEHECHLCPAVLDRSRLSDAEAAELDEIMAQLDNVQRATA